MRLKIRCPTTSLLIGVKKKNSEIHGFSAIYGGPHNSILSSDRAHLVGPVSFGFKQILEFASLGTCEKHSHGATDKHVGCV